MFSNKMGNSKYTKIFYGKFNKIRYKEMPCQQHKQFLRNAGETTWSKAKNGTEKTLIGLVGKMER